MTNRNYLMKVIMLINKLDFTKQCIFATLLCLLHCSTETIDTL